MAGPTRASKAKSGPMANGTRVTTIRKNSTPINAPPPTRTASLMSRTNKAASGLIAILVAGGRSLRVSQSQLPGGCEPDRTMGGGHNEPAVREVLFHEAGQVGLGRCVERRGRLV